MTRGSTLDERIDTHLNALRNLPYGHGSGRFLSFSDLPMQVSEHSEAGPDQILRILMADLAGAVGEDLLDHLDSVPLEQFCLMSTLRCEGTGLLLIALIKSFIASYANPATSDEAVLALKKLDFLRTVPIPSCN
ncbi:hypothetical protein [Pseudomonas nitroreducens]|uniref:hypothetical protein n=1 Tax=Pseudomonas nitroreducens TaxID=46680 RepID=UPI00351D05C6